jgi:hypothetical protein
MLDKLNRILIASLLSFFLMTEAYSADLSSPIKKEVVVADESIISEVIALMKYTRDILKDLDIGEKYGEISWPNSLTIDSAIETIDRVLSEDPIFTLDDVKDYEKDVVDYFSTYIEDDLNINGMEIYKKLQSMQTKLFSKIYKMYDSHFQLDRSAHAGHHH